MKLIVGLGNPGRKYENTRHNVGFDVLNIVAKRCGDAAAREKFDARVMDATLAGQRALLVWPQKYMNCSGQSVGAAAEFYQVPLDELLVVCDDFNLPLGKLRFRGSGSAGGQKGLADIISRLGSDNFSRLRIGIGPVPDVWNAEDFVLSRFSAVDRHVVDDAIIEAATGVECWAAEGIEASMNRFN